MRLLLQYALVAVLGVFTLITATTFISTDVVGSPNTTTITRVNITNTEPVLYQAYITPSPINLNPGNTTRVNCTAKVRDLNGWQDVNRTNATLYHINYGETGSTDKNARYRNLSCPCIQLDAGI